ncbi:MAG: hypothetical protein KGR98_05635 [Verrucomicrobia bacterium]|nr:hypothetical protein [Verrucomicrobiota bacterium]MDE3099449.1 hypothetical protein [Verrucomicrobiota bacterium]
METIMFKVEDGTKARLKRLGRMSTVLRGQVEKLLAGKSDEETAYAKAAGLCGIFSGPTNASITRDHRKKYAPKGPH